MLSGVRAMKPSGLGWAPEIPAHWDVAKICLVARLESGVRDRPLRGLGADLASGPPGGLRVRGLADADDRDLARDVLEVGRVTPVVHGPNRNVRRRRP